MSRATKIFMGPMFSGKSAKLIRAIEDARPMFSGGVFVLKHALDAPRDGPKRLRSRTGLVLEGVELADDSSLELVPCRPNALYAIDEGHFFHPDALKSFWKSVTSTKGTGFYLSGLDRDFRGEEWGGVPALAREALLGSSIAPKTVEVVRLTASCSRVLKGKRGKEHRCDKHAVFSQRLQEEPLVQTDDENSRVLVGGAESYQPSCVDCHSPTPLSMTEWFKRDERE